ncbi:MAG: two-component sensor histidine kinase [Flavisolibacter sp.]|nr:two-component sensor histidine kinase [Flavisolibacter sp.]
MSKRIFYTLSILLPVSVILGQLPPVDSLQQELMRVQSDTLKLLLLDNLAEAYNETKPDSSLFYAEKQLKLARKLNFKLNEVNALNQMGYALLNIGNYPRSLQTLLSGLTLAEDPKSEKNILSENYLHPDDFFERPVTAHLLRLNMLSKVHHNMAILYSNASDYNKQLFHLLQARQLTEQTGNSSELVRINLLLGRVYLALNKLDSARICEQNAYGLSMRTGYKKYLGSILLNLGRIELAQGKKQLSGEYLRRALAVSNEQKYLRGVVACNLSLANLYRQSGNKDSNLHYAKAGLQVAQYLNAPALLLRSYTELAAFYRVINNNDSTAKYQALIIEMNDSLFNSKQTQQFQNIDFYEQQRKQELKEAGKDFQNRLRTYGLLAGLTIFLLLSIILWHNSRQRKRTNILLEQQKNKIEKTLEELKATQTQLIQREKMASLGELTAGIAHEIQNPLNFVNNFSEVNNELLDEMKEELQGGNAKEALTVADEIKENNLKINHHGQRAGAIVKGMLQHSRNSTGEKQPTDINTLVDGYLRLSYNGLRAKDKEFNADFSTNFDESIGKIEVVPQDIGRVLLNLFNNAFYSVNEKKKQFNGTYEPEVSVSTKKRDGKIEIGVKDNGTGIPQRVVGKIFQPFFTTKPTGEGTGLGLSLSYDIITKGYGGELKVNSIEGKETEFIITIPV